MYLLCWKKSLSKKEHIYKPHKYDSRFLFAFYPAVYPEIYICTFFFVRIRWAIENKIFNPILKMALISASQTFYLTSKIIKINFDLTFLKIFSFTKKIFNKWITQDWLQVLAEFSVFPYSMPHFVEKTNRVGFSMQHYFIQWAIAPKKQYSQTLNLYTTQNFLSHEM